MNKTAVQRWHIDHPEWIADRVVSNGTLTASASGQGNARVYVLDRPGSPAPGKIGDDGPFLR